MPTEQILDEKQVAAIERAIVTGAFGNVVIKEYELRALCQTVRALQEKHAQQREIWSIGLVKETLNPLSRSTFWAQLKQ